MLQATVLALEGIIRMVCWSTNLKFYQNMKFFNHENPSEIIICEMVAIFSRRMG